jgi:hypothetical protein
MHMYIIYIYIYIYIHTYMNTYVEEIQSIYLEEIQVHIHEYIICIHEYIYEYIYAAALPRLSRMLRCACALPSFSVLKN